jgi:class 3 adenylate cyclase
MDQPRGRLSAVWFADIVGYSALSSRDEPAALRLVGIIQTAARRIVGAFEGRVVKFIGDAVLAEFGSTTSAVQAAVALQERFSNEARGVGIDAALRIGVHLGEVTATPDGDLYGDGINTAARLQREAAPGQVVVSEDVWRQLRQRPEFRFTSLGPVELRGITTRMTMYDVVFGARAALVPRPEAAGGPAMRRSSRARQRWIAGGAILAAAVAVGAYALRPGVATLERSIGVPAQPAAPARQPDAAPAAAAPTKVAQPAGAPAVVAVEPAATAPARAAGSPRADRAGPPRPRPASSEGDASPPSPADAARLRTLLQRFAAAVADPAYSEELRRLFPGFTPAHAQAFRQLHRGFGPGMQATLGRVQPGPVDGDSAQVRFVLLVRSERRPTTPVPFEATVSRTGDDWSFSDVRRPAGLRRSAR